MIKEIFYSGNKRFMDKIRKEKIIPYRVTPRVKYEANKWYYNDYWRQCFKIISVGYTNAGFLDEAYIKWDDGNYGLICTDLDICDFRLEKDRNKIYKDNIVNSDKFYSGAEIVYWFFMNNINCSNEKYNGFWKYVDTHSAHRLSDTTRYKVKAIYDEKTDTYKECKIIKIM